MKRNLKFSVILFIPLISIVFLNCYFNPVVNGLLNPIEKEDNNSFLGLLGFGVGASDLLITGQIRDPFGNAISGLNLVPSSVSPQSKITLPPYTTDITGRFYIPFQSGTNSFQVLQNESLLFTLTLVVADPTNITAETSGAPQGLEISSLGAISGITPPSFFELVSVFAVEGVSTLVNIHNTNIGKSPSNLLLTFSEAPAYVDPEDTSWVQNSVIISPLPSAGYQISQILGNQIKMNGAEGFPSGNVFTIDFTNNIKSASGISLTPRRIKFCYGLPEGCLF